MNIPVVACIKWGDKFPAYYVNRLYAGVCRFMNQPFQFYCVTDNPSGIRSEVTILPLPEEPFAGVVEATLAESRRKGAFGKISLFKNGLIDTNGPVLGFDLDVVITGAIDPLFSFSPGKICMRRDWLAARRNRPDGHGSVFRFNPQMHGYLYDDFANDPVTFIRKSRYSEQKYTSMNAQQHNDFAYFPDSWIGSFKRDAMRYPPLNLFLEPDLPVDTRIMCFHGNPKMEEAVQGYKTGILRRTRPCHWLKTYWESAEENVQHS